MPNRLDNIVTRGGDKGETSLADGTRLPKDDLRIALIGDVDELNSAIGVVIAHLTNGALVELLTGIQHDLFDLGGGLCFPDAPVLSEKHVTRLDKAAALLNADLPPLKDFILPGGAPSVSFCHLARAVCRRAERTMVAYERVTQGAGHGLQYLNRLSDVLFIVARAEVKSMGLAEVIWRKDNSLT